MSVQKSLALREVLEGRVQEALGKVDFSALRPELHEVATAYFIATTKAKTVLAWTLEQDPRLDSDEDLDELLTECFDELMDTRLALNETCLAYEDEKYTVSHENVVGWVSVQESVRYLRQKSLNREQLIVALNSYFVGTTSVTLELPIFRSIIKSESKRSTQSAWRQEVTVICNLARSRDFDTILRKIVERAGAEDPIFQEVVHDEQTIFWTTKAGASAKFKFRELRTLLRKLSDTDYM